MTNLTKLIQKLCPNGVEYVKLSHISRRLNEKNSGLKYNIVRAVTSSGRLVDPLTIFKDSVASEDKSNYLVVRKYNYIYNPARINIGSIAYSQEEEPVILSPMYIVFDLNKDKVLNDYFDYFIRSSEGRRQIISRVEEGARFRFPYESMEKLSIPLPPLTVQKEIVQILNQFKQLITELTAELTARKQQYEYYKNYLFKNIKHSLVFTLGEVTSIKTGSKPKEIFDSPKKYEYINAGTTNSGYSNVKNYEGETVTTPSRGQGGIGFVGYQEKEFWLGPLCYGIRSLNTNIVINRYIYHYLSCNNKKILTLKNEGGTPSVNASDLAKISIEVPVLSDQQSIVDILDKFDKLVNDISEGIPAEIAARQKQYEYYRDKLLTFKEVGNESI